MTIEQIKCPYCGTSVAKDIRTKRTTCNCRRLHEKPDFNGKKYTVLYKKDGTKEIMR